jgi:hypothetical protein
MRRAADDPTRRARGGGERGAVLVQVAVAMTALCGLSALAVDFGLLMAARSQAQAAADAGALAGATAIGFDDFGGLNYYGRVVQPAQAVARANLVLNQPPSVGDADVSVTAMTIPGFPPSPGGGRTRNSVVVSVFRNREHGNPLPTFFGRLVGVDAQGVRAQASATIVPSDASDCVWPLAIPDDWVDNNGVSSFVKYAATGPPAPAVPADAYTAPRFSPPGTVNPGTGYQVPVSLNINVPLTLTTVTGFALPAEHGRYVAVQVPRRDGAGFSASLSSCNGTPVVIGDLLPVDSAGGVASLPSALSAAAARVAADPNASWNPTTLRVQNSCAYDPVPCAALSPRIVVLPLFDLNRYELTRWNGAAAGATPQIEVVNFVGFFITQVTGTGIRGQLTLSPGRLIAGRPMVGYTSAFLRSAVLTR